MSKPTLPQGTRDFSSEVLGKRNFIFENIRHVFQIYGFQPLETPAMENLETLMGKYGEEGDKLIFKILNNGLDNPAKMQQARDDFEKVLEGKNVRGITERALRYDLTIPFARYVATNHGQLTFPFKRYQIQPVWRADKPQKGRYREFYQCDADIVGSYSLLNEVELANIYLEVFNRLNIPVEIRLNNRKILAALAESCAAGAKMTEITVAIDKLDKIGIDGVKKELEQRGLNSKQIKTIEEYLAITGSNGEKLQQLKSLLGDNETANKGIQELEFLNSFFQTPANCPISFDFTLARGLNYYTGIIYEVKAQNVQIGSIGGGGRYDDLTGLFGVPNLPGVGISFGVDRIFDVMDELQLFPSNVHTGTEVLFFNLGDNESKVAYQLMQQLRANDIKCEIFHERAKFDKQFKYAERKNIPFAVMIGAKEVEEKTSIVKDLRTGEQQIVTQAELLNLSFR